MPYLTYEEYNDLGFVAIEQPEFDRLLKRASDVLDSVTRDFYQFHNLEEDVSIRRDKFKRAVACQIEYFHETGATSTYGLNEPASVQIGRTSMSQGARGSQSQNAPQNTVVSDDVYMYLIPVGLAYRGVGVF